MDDSKIVKRTQSTSRFSVNLSNKPQQVQEKVKNLMQTLLNLWEKDDSHLFALRHLRYSMRVIGESNTQIVWARKRGEKVERLFCKRCVRLKIEWKEPNFS